MTNAMIPAVSFNRENDTTMRFWITAVRMFDGLKTMINVARERRQLAGLDEAQLSDMGISPAQAQAEAARPFWDISSKR